MTKEQMLARVAKLIAHARDVARGGDVEPEQALNGALTVMAIAYGGGAAQIQTILKRRDDIAKQYGGAPIGKGRLGDAILGVLENLREEIEAGLLTSLEHRVTSDVLSDLIQLARAALAENTEGAKNVAAVLSAAAYEDTIRRIAKDHAGVIGRDKLETVISKLKDAGLLVAPQLGIANGYLKFRNDALHADWANIERASIVSVLAFVESLLLTHFA